jgi:hypothetical protein
VLGFCNCQVIPLKNWLFSVLRGVGCSDFEDVMNNPLGVVAEDSRSLASQVPVS